MIHIQGTAFTETDNFFAFMSALKACPPTVQFAQRRPQQIVWPNDGEPRKAITAAEDASRMWRRAEEGADAEAVEALFAKAENLAEAADLPKCRAQALERLATFQLEVARVGNGDAAMLKKGAASAAKALKAWRDADAPINMGQAATTLTQDMMALKFSIDRNAGRDGWPSVDKFDSLLTDILRQTRHAYRLAQGPEIAGALRIDQGEFGVSDSTPIGTDNVQDCIAVILRDPTSKSTAVCHIDSATEQASIACMFEALPKPANGTLWEMRLVGSKPWMSGQSNLDKLLGVMRANDYPVDILSASVQERYQGSCFVVDPKTGKVQEGFPAREPQHGDLSNARALVASGYKLACAFDTRKGDARNPVRFDRDALANLDMRYPSDGVSDIYRAIQGRYGNTGSVVGAWSLDTREMRMAVNEARSNLRDQINNRLDAIEEQNIRVPQSARFVLREILTRLPLYVGEGSAAANTVVADFVMTNVFRIEDGALVADTSAVDGYKLPDAIGWKAMPQVMEAPAQADKAANENRRQPPSPGGM